ncbi:MAG: Protein of unknown function precursor containing a C-terminal secretion signal [Bacteroidetes bacterium]|nr:Protein of unknown function precursor containing a C-terminal secretion signal [Bacteroidota bacterium]
MKKILLIVFVLFSIGSKAQVNIGMGHLFPTTGLFAHYDTVVNGAPDTIGVWVKNYGSAPFNGKINIHVGVQDTTFPGVIDSAAINTDTLYVSGFNPGDSILATYTTNYTVSTGMYRYGIDVIVVWPVASYNSGAVFEPHDSLQFPVFIEYPESVNELDINRIIKLYPNPGTDRITIENVANTPVETVIIYDTSGKAVLTEKRKNTIDIQNLAPGVYHAEVYLSDKKHYSIKFIKQKN